MKSKVIEKYFNYIENQFACLILEELQGQKYILSRGYGSGEIIRIPINKYMEIAFFTISSNCNFDFDFVSNSDLLIVSYCLKGLNEIYKNGQKLKFSAGDIKFYRGQNIEKIVDCQLSDYMSVSLLIDLNYCEENKTFSREIELYANSICKGNSLRIMKAPDYINKKMQEISIIEALGFIDCLRINELTYDVFLDILKIKVNNEDYLIHKKSEEYILNVEKIVVTNISRTIHLNELVEILGISLYKLQKIFKEYRDTTIYKFIKNLKLDYSKKLLEGTNYSIIEIANIIGYENPSKYSSAFKQNNKITPSQYRKKF